MMKPLSLFVYMTVVVFSILVVSCPSPLDESILTLLQDTTSPNIVVESPADYSEYATIIKLSGYITDESIDNMPDGSGITLSYSIDGTSIADTISVDTTDGTFSTNINVSSLSGDKVIKLSTSDINGNSYSTSINIVKPDDGGDISNFTATPGNKEVTLSWDAIEEAESYSIYESNFCNTVSGLTDTSYTWSDLDNGEVYTFQVTANIAEDGAENAVSGKISKMPLSSNTFCPWIKATGDRSITIEWSDNDNVTNFIVERKKGEDGSWKDLRTLSDNYLVDNSLDYDTTYYYRVTPSNYQDIASAAENAVPGSFGFNPLSTCSTKSEAYKTAISGNYAYVADDSGGMQIIDISDKKNPVLLSTYKADSYVWGVDADEEQGYAYVGGASGYLDIVDISDKYNPTLYNQIYLGAARSVHLNKEGDSLFAYVTTTSNSTHDCFYKVDVTDPASPSTVFSTIVKYTQTEDSLIISDSVSYVATISASYGLCKVEYNGESASYTLGVVTGEYTGIDIYNDNYILLAGGNTGLVIYSISDNSSLTISAPDNVNGVAVSGNYAYAACCSYGVQVYDLSQINMGDSDSVFRIDSFDTLGYTRDITVEDGYVYVSDGNYGIEIIKEYNPPIIDTGNTYYKNYSSTYLASNTTDIDISEDYLYLSYYYHTSSSGVRIFELNSPLSPYIKGFASGYGGYSYSFDIKDDKIYLANGTVGLKTFDATSKTSPASLGICDASAWLQGKLRVYGDYAYNTCSAFGLLIFDVSDPENPEIVANQNLGNGGIDLSISGNYAYVADSSDGLYVIDISDPKDPDKTALLSLGGLTSVATDDNYAYVGLTKELDIIDISEPDDPAVKSTCTLYGDPASITVSGNYAFITTSDGLEIVNMVDKTSPFISSAKSLDDTASSIALRGSYAYLATQLTNYAGVQIFDLTNEE